MFVGIRETRTITWGGTPLPSSPYAWDTVEECVRAAEAMLEHFYDETGEFTAAYLLKTPFGTYLHEHIRGADFWTFDVYQLKNWINDYLSQERKITFNEWQLRLARRDGYGVVDHPMTMWNRITNYQFQVPLI